MNTLTVFHVWENMWIHKYSWKYFEIRGRILYQFSLQIRNIQIIRWILIHTNIILVLRKCPYDRKLRIQKSKGVFTNDDKQHSRSSVTVFKFSLLPSHLPFSYSTQSKMRNIFFKCVTIFFVQKLKPASLKIQIFPNIC